MLRRVWANPEDRNTWKTKIEEHIYRDGSIEYSFRDNRGRSHDVSNWIQAQYLIKEYRLIDVTDKMFEAGWIAPEVYKEVLKQRNQG